MNGWQIALTIGATVTIYAAWGLPRAVTWVALGALSFITSTAWSRYGFPYSPFFGGMTNLVIIALIYSYGRERWETLVAYCFFGMILLDSLYLIGAIGPRYWFVAALEVANWAALAIIAFTSIPWREWVRDRGSALSPAYRWIGGVHRSIRAQRTDTPWGWRKVP